MADSFPVGPSASTPHCRYLWLYIYNICLNLPSLSPLMNLVIPTPRDHHPHCLIQVFAWHLHICLLQKEWQQAGVGSPFYKHVKHSPSGSILDFISCVCVGFDRPSQYVPYHFSGVENKQKCWIEATPWSGTVYMDGTDDLHLQRKVWSAFSSPSHAAAPHR